MGWRHKPCGRRGEGCGGDARGPENARVRGGGPFVFPVDDEDMERDGRKSGPDARQGFKVFADFFDELLAALVTLW